MERSWVMGLRELGRWGKGTSRNWKRQDRFPPSTCRRAQPQGPARTSDLSTGDGKFRRQAPTRSAPDSWQEAQGLYENPTSNLPRLLTAIEINANVGLRRAQPHVGHRPRRPWNQRSYLLCAGTKATRSRGLSSTATPPSQRGRVSRAGLLPGGAEQAGAVTVSTHFCTGLVSFS